jgi:hypothetical protein
LRTGAQLLLGAFVLLATMDNVAKMQIEASLMKAGQLFDQVARLN